MKTSKDSRLSYAYIDKSFSSMEECINFLKTIPVSPFHSNYKNPPGYLLCLAELNNVQWDEIQKINHTKGNGEKSYLIRLIKHNDEHTNWVCEIEPSVNIYADIWLTLYFKDDITCEEEIIARHKVYWNETDTELEIEKTKRKIIKTITQREWRGCNPTDIDTYFTNLVMNDDPTPGFNFLWGKEFNFILYSLYKGFGWKLNLNTKTVSKKIQNFKISISSSTVEINETKINILFQRSGHICHELIPQYWNVIKKAKTNKLYQLAIK